MKRRKIKSITFNTLLIKGVYFIDPYSEMKIKTDIFFERDVLAEMGNISNKAADIVINADGLIGFPALIDLHVHFREPGYEEAETIRSGLFAAMLCGFEEIVAMPNTTPCVDNIELCRRNLEIAKSIEFPIKFKQSASLTIGRKGEKMVDFRALSRVGVPFFTDDGSFLSNQELKVDILKEIKRIDSIYFSHAEDPEFVIQYGVDSRIANDLNLEGGSPEDAELSAIEKDIDASSGLKARIHFTHISTKDGAELIVEKKRANPLLSFDVTPHHLCLTMDRLKEIGTNAKMNPPLRTVNDTDGLWRLIEEDEIDAIATDHAPHSKRFKSRALGDAPSGVTGLDTAVAALYTECNKRGIDFIKVVRLMTEGPARILKKSIPDCIRHGYTGGIVVIDPSIEIEVNEDILISKSSNNAFLGLKLKGWPVLVINRGILTTTGIGNGSLFSFGRW